jgi:hypothetical protein
MIPLRSLAWLGLATLIFIVFVAGCQHATARRLHLLALLTPVLDTEASLELSGVDLPVGASASVELSGSLYAPGRVVRPVREALRAVVISPERVVVSVGPALIEAWGRGSFQGDLTLSCGRPAADAALGRLEHARFDLDGPAQPLERLHREAQALLGSLGLEASDEDSFGSGLLVRRVFAHGPAARAGLQAGDRVLRSEGVSLRALADLAPPPSAAWLRLSVRSASGELRSLRVWLLGGALWEQRRALALALVSCAILFLLLRSCSLPRLRAPLASLGEPAAVRGMVLVMGLSLAIVRFPSAFDPRWLLLGQLGLVAIARRRNLGAWFGFSIDAAGLWLGLLCVAALSGTFDWSGIAAEQGGWPWQWSAFSRPPLSLASWLCVGYGARLQASLRRGQSSWLGQGADDLGRALLAVLFAGLFLRAFSGQAASGTEFALAGASAGLKAALCWAGLWLMPTAGQRSRIWLVALPLSCAAWAWLAPNPSFEAACGAVSCLVCAALLLTAAGRALGGTAGESEELPALIAAQSAAPPQPTAAGSAVPTPAPAPPTVVRAAECPLDPPPQSVRLTEPRPAFARSPT